MRIYHELNLGAGVQSTTLALMFEEGLIVGSDGIPIHIDVAYFADTGEEPAAVYRHLHWLSSHIKTFPIKTVSKGKLGDDLMRVVNSTGQRFASIPAYTKEAGSSKEGQTRRQCSKEYKIDPIEQAIRRELLGLAPGRPIPNGVRVVQYLGISFEESGRAVRVMRNRIPKKFREEAKRWDYARLKHFISTRRMTFEFPLVDRFMKRTDCISVLASRVPHKVPRSACTFCPYHDDSEWQSIREVEEDWNRVLQLDAALRTPGIIANCGMDADMFLHRSCQPIHLVKLDTKPKPRDLQLSMSFAGECLGVCGL